MVSYVSELRQVCLFLGEIMCSLCVLNELLAREEGLSSNRNIGQFV